MLGVSVVMCTYNRAWIIDRAIESIMGQSYQDFEIIIIDDGSTDNTSNHLKQLYSDERIHIVTSQVNRGVAVSRNIGLKKAKGELIAYLDSDNLWYPNYLEMMLPAFDTREVVFAYSGQNTLLVGGTRKQPKILGLKTRNYPYNPCALMQANYIDIGCVVHRKSLMKQVGYFDEKLETFEDWDLFARIALEYPFGILHIDQVLSDYYFYLPKTEPTVTNQRWPKWIEGQFGLTKTEGPELTVKNKIKRIINKTYYRRWGLF